MIAPEGFNTLVFFRNAVRSAILNQILAYLPAPAERGTQTTLSISNNDSAYPGSAIVTVASNEIVSKVASNSHLNIEIVVNERTPFVKIPSGFLRPSVKLVCTDESASKQKTRLDFVNTFKQGQLAEFLCENGSLAITPVHASLAKRMVVNYVTGCIDTSVLEADCRFNSLSRELRSARDDVLDRMAGFAGVATDKEDSYSIPHHWSDLESNSLLKMLTPYNGFPLLLREETCQNALEWLGVEAWHESQIDELQPSDQILVEFEESPANKSEIKLRLFPDMSGREFDKHWWAASQINPNLSAPGRKASSDSS